MASIQHNCPHCLTAAAGFSIQYQYTIGSSSPVGHNYMCFAKCGRCETGIVIQYAPTNNKRTASPMEVSGDPALNGWIAKKIWPEEEAVDIPDFLPDNVRVPFQQALDNLTRKNWDAAGMMFRKALEVGTKAIDPSLASKKLVVRIDELAARYAITPDLKDWAHKIRIGGNDAAHDDDPFEETEAVDLEYFCRLFLTYVFTLPAKLKQRVDSNP